MKALHKSLILAALVVGSFAATGCGASAEEDEVNASPDALKQGEIESRVIAADIESTDPKATGVDSWRISLVHSSELGWFWLATGTKTSTSGRSVSVLEMVITDENFAFRSPDESALELGADRRKALGEDFGVVAKALGSDTDGDTTTQTLRPRSGRVRDCAAAVGVSAFDAVATILTGVGGGVLCAGGAIVVGGLASFGDMPGSDFAFCDTLLKPMFRSAKRAKGSTLAVPNACAGVPSGR